MPEVFEINVDPTQEDKELIQAQDQNDPENVEPIVEVH